jgi:zinc transport system substrate-binding protein
MDLRMTICSAFCLMAGMVGCGSATSPAPTGDANSSLIGCFVTIQPQADFVRRIGRDRVSVEVLVGPGQSEHTFDATPRQMTALAGARVYFCIGVPCEKSLLPKIADVNPRLEIVDTSAGVNFRHGGPCCAPHPAGSAHDEQDDELVRDPHIWLDPRLVKIQARNICDALAKIDPTGASIYRRNCAEFEEQLDKLHAELTSRLAPFKGSEFIVFHPAYGYLADAYGLRQIAVEEDGKEPTIKQLTGLIDLAKRKNIRDIFVQPQFATAGAATVASAVRGRTVVLDPMVTDYVRDMRAIVEKLANSFESRVSPEQISASVAP